MKQYKIFVSPLGITETVKQGFCWPAFIFTWLWCFVKKNYALGFVVFAQMTILNIFYFSSSEMGIIVILACLTINFWLGVSGYSLREVNLIKRGFELKTILTASNKEGALALYVKDKNQN